MRSVKKYVYTKSQFHCVRFLWCFTKDQFFVFLDPLLNIGCHCGRGLNRENVEENGWNTTDRLPPQPGGRDYYLVLNRMRTPVSTGISYWPTVRVGGCRVWRSNRTVETATSSETDRLIARREARVRWGAGRKERSGCARTGVDASRRSLADAGRRAGAASGSHGEYPPYPNPPNPQLSAGHMVTALLVHSHPPSTI